MLNPSELAKKFESLRQLNSLNSLQIAPLSTVNFKHDLKILQSEDVQALLGSISKAQGWIQFTDKNQVLPCTLTNGNRVLAAEYCHEGKSFKLQYTDNNQWQWNQFELVEDPNGKYLVHTSEQCAVMPNQTFVYYIIYEVSANGTQLVTSILKELSGGIPS